MNTLRQMGVNEGNANKNMEKLSSGQRINRAGDDAAGLAISEKMRGQIRG
jgi:flagellin